MSNGDKNIHILYQYAMRAIMDKYASNKCFFTQKEFEDNRVDIFEITKAKRVLKKELVEKNKLKI